MAYLMIVDDEHDSRDLLCRFLMRCGHEVLCVGNGREALESIFNRAPDLIVLDLLMPEMDGPDLLSILRSYLRFTTLPVVVLTAAPHGPESHRARELGANAILPKAAASLAEIHSVIMDTLRPIASP